MYRTHFEDCPVKRFADLSEQEVLALSITNEDEDSRIYRGFAEGLRKQYPASAKVFDEMADEEVRHRTMLFDLYRTKFGEYLPLIRRQDVKGFITKKPLWLMQPLNLEEVRKFAETMEFEAERFYRRAADTTRDASTRQLLLELAEIESQHEDIAHKLEESILTPSAREKEDETARRMFLLQYVQPGLAGLMDGSVSTLAPLFWTATTVAIIVVALELVAISYIRYRYMDTPFLSAAFQVVLGGTLVFLAGILIGSA
jgi:rubrerythrin